MTASEATSSPPQDEVTRLRRENEKLRARLGRLGLEPPDAPGEDGPAKPERILLLPDPGVPPESGGLGPEAIAGAAEVVLRKLRESQPNVSWRTEYDLDQIPAETACFQLGQVLGRMWDGTGPFPMTFHVERNDHGQSALKRCAVGGDPDSQLFLDLLDRQISIADDLIAEADVAFASGAKHHAGWFLKAIDLVLAQFRLGMARFECGRDDWREPLSQPRPEYNPKYGVSADLPAGL